MYTEGLDNCKIINAKSLSPCILILEVNYYANKFSKVIAKQIPRCLPRCLFLSYRRPCHDIIILNDIKINKYNNNKVCINKKKTTERIGC